MICVHLFSVTIWWKLLQNAWMNWFECLSKLTVSMLLVNQSALSGLKNLEVAILTWGTKNVFGGNRSVWSIMSCLNLAKPQSNFASWYCTITYRITGQGNDWSIQLGNTFARGLLTRLDFVRLLFICIDGTRTFWPALHSLRKWLYDRFASKERQFFWRGIHQLPDRWEKRIASDGQYFE